MISTTHGAETHALRAGIKTIEEFKKRDVISHIRKITTKVKEECKRLIEENGLLDFVEVQGDNWILGFVFKNSNREVDAGYRTYFMQEMIKKGILFQTAFVPSYSHQEAELTFFFEGFEESLKLYLIALNEDINLLLDGPPAKPVFRKYL